MRRPLDMFSCLLVFFVLSSCSEPKEAAQPSSGATNPDASATRIMPPELLAPFYARVHQRFTNPHYLKPLDEQSAHLDRILPLAPLLLLRSPEEEARPQFFGPSLEDPARTMGAVEPTIYVESGSLPAPTLGLKHWVAFRWWIRWGDDQPLIHQGVRLLMDAQNMPRAWEVLDDPSGAVAWYVSQAFEDRAQKTYGGVHPGRVFHSERAVGRAPNAAVARILTDGPVPMGPWVYQLQDGTVPTVICRCMPSQCDALRDGVYYKLALLPADFTLLHPEATSWGGSRPSVGDIVR